MSEVKAEQVCKQTNIFYKDNCFNKNVLESKLKDSIQKQKVYYYQDEQNKDVCKSSLLIAETLPKKFSKVKVPKLCESKQDPYETDTAFECAILLCNLL